MLDLSPRHTIYDIVSIFDQLDEEMLNDFLTIHNSGMKVLPAPINPTQSESISSEMTKNIVEMLSKMSDFMKVCNKDLHHGQHFFTECCQFAPVR